MKAFKKTLLLCVLILVIGTFLGATFKANAYSDVVVYDTTISNGTVLVPQTAGVVGMRLSVNSPIEGFAFCLAKWGPSDEFCANLSVYKWDTFYSKTVSAEPLKTKRFTDIAHRSVNWVYFDSALPAGEYFFCVEDVEGCVSCLTYNDNCSYNKGFTYQNSLERTISLDLTLRLTSTAGTIFNKCTTVSANHGTAPTYSQITADQTNLDQYNLPANSLYLKNDVLPDTWAFTDSLGRVGYTSAQVGGPKSNKTLAMFYWTWHTAFSVEGEAFNVQEFLDQQAAMGVDLSAIKNDYDYAGWPTEQVKYFWNEPIYGYYSTDDAWVLRKQAELLANAGVDTIFTDNSNGQYIWNDSYVPLYEAWLDAMADGVESPKVSYMLPFGHSMDAPAQMEMLYQNIYRDGNYQSLWYWLDGKPMLMAWPDKLDTTDGLQKEIYNFFTFRRHDPDYLVSNPSVGHWGWLSMYPQAKYAATQAEKNAGKYEQISVGVAQNHDYVAKTITSMNGTNVADRTYTSNGYDKSANAILKGANFAQQFNYALGVNPEVIFVTGWNEWSAMRQKTWQGVENAFADQYDDKNSRDLEPTRGDLGDAYYYQLVNFVRQFKGVTPVPSPTTATTMNVNNSPSQWEGVQPYFASYIGNIDDRDADGYGTLHYVDYSGRNDIIGSQIARDAHDVYILVECADDITPYTDPLWMNVYLDVNSNNKGWESFDFVINKRTPKNESVAYLEKFTGNGYNTTLVGEVQYSVKGRYLQIKVPLSYLGLSGYSYTINYSITDNVHDVEDQAQLGDTDYVYTKFSGDILDFYTSGDVAPGGRFKFSYVSTNANAGFVTNKYTNTLESWRANIVFDPEVYRSRHKDLSWMTDSQLYNHWIEYGIKEGRCASAIFDVKYYVENNKDLKAAFGTNYVAAYNHFVNHGYKEKRLYSPVMDGKYYCEHQKDVYAAKGDDYLIHYFQFGMKEGRQASENFNVHYYLKLRTDVANAWPGNLAAATRHYISYGVKEGTKGNDNQAPVISNVSVTNLSKSGFTIICNVVDDQKLTRVSFAVWTAKNGQDDLNRNWVTSCNGTKKGDVYTYRVNASEHNYEAGTYTVHIYGWDLKGNEVCYPIDVTIK